MAVPLPPEVQKFIEGKVFAHVATLMKDGAPQVTPVWVDHDGKNVLINTATGRLKTNNLKRDARVAMSIMGLDNEYRTVFIRGRVKDVTTEGADAHIDKLSAKYTGNPRYGGHRPTEKRVIVVIEPTHVRVSPLVLGQPDARTNLGRR